MNFIETEHGRHGADCSRRLGPRAIIGGVRPRIDSSTAPKPAHA